MRELVAEARKLSRRTIADLHGNEQLRELVAESRKLSRRKIADLHAADQLVSRHSCGAWTFAGIPCGTCERAGKLAGAP